MHNVTGLRALHGLARNHELSPQREDITRTQSTFRVILSRVSFAKGIEPERDEWFMNGTEPVDAVTRNTLHAKPRIVYPANETFIVLDPEIPDDLQRVLSGFSQRLRIIMGDQRRGDRRV